MDNKALAELQHDLGQAVDAAALYNLLLECIDEARDNG